jgi:hypothetical protein
MRQRGIDSPDVIDALALSFAFSRKSAYSGINPVQVANAGVQSFYPGIPG